jgi:hypothetical protein
MILNSESVKLIRTNAERLANSVKSKDDLTTLAAAASFDEVFEAIESILTNTEMYFDDELLTFLDENNFQSFKATLLVYAFNNINRKTLMIKQPENYQGNNTNYSNQSMRMQ